MRTRARSQAAPPSTATELSAEEREAEILFREAVHRRVSKSEACIRASDLERRSPIAGQCRRWLLQRHRAALSAGMLTADM